MADPVAIVERIVKLGLKIKEAVDTVRQNEEECHEIRKRVLRFSAILSQLQQTGMMDNSPAMSGALEDLEETLERALELLTACQERSTIRRLIAAGELSKQLRRVKDDMLNKVMLASFAINAHATIVLLSIQGGAHPHPPRQPAKDAETVDTSCSSHSTSENRSELYNERNNVLEGSVTSSTPSRVLREFRFSELKAATNNFSDGNIIGKGGFSIVYKGVLTDGRFVAIKKAYRPDQYNRVDSYNNQHVRFSKLHHKNIVKVLGYAHPEAESSVVRLLKRKTGRANKERTVLWVEEYLPNGNLRDIINGSSSQLDWPSLFRIIIGVAQGLCYLHDQGLVHRDVKPRNVLLDSDMNPQIIDFDLLVASGDDGEIEDGVAGTMGYIAPEHITDGIVSRKNDVFAFGITLLETVGSIRRCVPPRQVPLSAEWAWLAWNDGRLEEEFDPSVCGDDDGSQLMEIKRCVQVGLLCAQNDRANRPTMADALEMLHGLKELPTPKSPPWIKQFQSPR